jgi:S-layer family protein/PKD domain-containing protein
LIGRFSPCPSSFLAASSGLWKAALLSVGLLLLAGVGHAQQTASGSTPTATFSTPGTHQVTLQACNAAGCTSMTKTVVVLDPRPQIASAAIPPRVGVGQAVLLQAAATGRPPLTYRWMFDDGTDPVEVLGNPVTWAAPADVGSYQAHLEVTNGDGFAATAPVAVSVVPWTFTDVPPTHWAWRFIENLFARGISSGCGPQVFCPDNDVSRAEMAVFLLLAKEGTSFVPPPCTEPMFSDVPCSSPFAPWIQELARRGVTAGCGGGAYCPTASVTRAEMAVFLLVTKEGSDFAPDPTCLTDPFNDVPCASPFAKWIRELVSRGVTAGCGGGAYCPTGRVNRAQMAIFLSVAFDLPPP